ncbi:MAG: ABC transporter ATP-binding protein [bacterium]|nr:ABC transporter ATP-binding protein [bacterium]
MALIEARNIVKAYPDGTRALSDVSFDIQEGEFVAIMGPSGSGKSTLLHVLGFLDGQTSGTYRYNGKSGDQYEPDEIAKLRNQKMGFVFQSFNLLPRTDVLENVALPLVYAGIGKKEREKMALKAIRLVGLSSRIHHDCSVLSGGEKQRVAIARALVNTPDIIFADEPTGNLDSASGRVVLEFLQKLHSEHGHTIILITHEQSTAEHAERILSVRDGQLESDVKVEHRRFAKEGYEK